MPPYVVELLKAVVVAVAGAVIRIARHPKNKMPPPT